MPRETKIFSKSLTPTDTKKRLAIPSKILSQLPGFNNGSHSVEIPLVYGTREWQIVCSIRKEGYKKPVFSGGWRDFVSCNDFRVGDELTLYKVQEDDGSFYYRVEVQKPAARRPRPSANDFPPALSVIHEVEEFTGTGCGKFSDFEHEKEELLKADDVPLKEEGAITEPANNAIAIVPFDDHVGAKSPNTIFCTGRSDEETASKASFKNDREPHIKFIGTTVSITGMGEGFHAYYMTKPFDLNGDGGSPSYATSDDAGETCHSSTERFGLDLIPVQSTPNGEEVNLELTLAQPIVDVSI